MKFGVVDMQGVAGSADPIAHAEKLEAWGYDAYWIPDLLSYHHPDPFVLLAAVAARTSRLRVGTDVAALPLRSPFQLAKLVTSVDVLSNGRFDLGVGIGLVPEEFALEGVEMRMRAPISNEILEIVKRLLNEEGVSHAGERYRFENFTLEPRPIQQPGVPIWVGGIWYDGIAEGVVQRTARWGDGFIPGRMPVAGYRESHERISERARAEGRDLSSFRWGASTWACLDSSAERARESILSIMRGEGGGSNAATSSGAPLNPEALLTGTPRECIDTIERYQGAGVNEFMIVFGCAPEHLLEQYQQFAEEVIPHFRR